nr:hypothetical protein [uncultured Lachnoclostridium sp.]
MERLKQYVKCNVHCTNKKREDNLLYNEFKRKMQKYLINEELELYRIPILSEDYQYAHKLFKTYASKCAMENYQGFYIKEQRILETDYTKKDYEQAVAYLVDFGYFAYPYETISDSDYEGPCCEKPDWYHQIGLIQNKIYKIPASEFKKRKYAQLMIGYAFHEEVKKLLIENHLASENDFQKVITKRNETVCYQIKPENVIHGFAEDNKMELFDFCRNCGLPHYHYKSEPYCISGATLEQLKGLNQTRETSGTIFKEQNGAEMPASLVEPWYILSKEAYTLLHKHYPRMQFIPIFLKEEKEQNADTVKISLFKPDGLMAVGIKPSDFL